MQAEGAHASSLSRWALLGRAAASAAGLFAIGTTRGDPAWAVRWPGPSEYGADVPTAWFLALGLGTNHELECVLATAEATKNPA